MNNFSKLGLVGGAIFSVLALFRYFVIWSDLDKGIAYVAIGLLVMAVSFLYDRQRDTGNVLIQVEEYLAAKPWKKQ